jgi:hypothetical protein
MGQPLPSSRVVISAPMSFSGSYARTMNWFWRGRPVWLRATVSWWAIPIIVLMWWGLIAGWYLLFGLFLVPWRLIRRGARKRRKRDLQHQELVDAVRHRRG